MWMSLWKLQHSSYILLLLLNLQSSLALPMKPAFLMKYFLMESVFLEFDYQHGRRISPIGACCRGSGFDFQSDNKVLIVAARISALICENPGRDIISKNSGHESCLEAENMDVKI